MTALVPLWLIARRELLAMFRIPLGWVVIALFALLAAVAFSISTLRPGEPASMRAFFGLAGGLLVVVCPAISMRLVSEELRTGSAELLTTAPVGDATVIWGKYLGACLFLLAMLAPTLALVLSLILSSTPAPALLPIASGYLSLVLGGMLYLAVGLLASVLTHSQTLAYLAALLTLVGAQLGVIAAARVLPAEIASALLWSAVPLRISTLASGLIDLRDVVFFLGISSGLVVLAAVLHESRRWA